MKEYFIPFNTPSSKNGKVKTGRGVFHGKTVKDYLNKLGIVSFSSSKKEMKSYKNKPNLFLQSLEGFEIKEYPVKLGFHFVRDSHRRWDFHNLVQLPLDLMTAANIIEDDDMTHIIPFPYQKNCKWFTVDKNNPGLYITIL